MGFLLNVKSDFVQTGLYLKYFLLKTSDFHRSKDGFRVEQEDTLNLAEENPFDFHYISQCVSAESHIQCLISF